MRTLLIFTILFFHNFFTAAGQSKLEVLPAHPERGEKVTIRYNPAAPGATISPEAMSIEMVFSYSNFYEYPWRMVLHKKGAYYETSFVVPHYATYATFYVQSGEKKDFPAANQHFELAVYQNNKRVKNGYLYESYSLSAQLGKTPDLEQKKAALLQKELQAFPDNYEAKLRLLTYKISAAEEKDKEALRKQARAIIAAKFMEKPGNMGYMNSTTMGYLIMGENSRLDSIRKVAKEKFPNSEVGYSMRISDIGNQTDSAQMVAQLHQLLKAETAQNQKFFSSAHEILFKYYAARQDADKALFHLGKMNSEFTPYTPVHVKEQATILLRANVALETALRLAKHALNLADTFPVGVIRYFPETGHIPSYVSREQRQETTKKATANVLTLIAMIRAQQGFPEEAQTMIAQAQAMSADLETLSNAGDFYNNVAQHRAAFAAYKKIMMAVPEDTLTLAKMKNSFKRLHPDLAGWDQQMEELQAHWKNEMLAQLKKEMIQVPAPDFVRALVDLKGQSLSPDLIRDKIVVVDFWATWCVPCMHEMPYVQNAYNKFKDRDDVLFMVINSGAKNTLADAQGWWGNKRYSFPVFYNNDQGIGEKFGFNLIPATYIIDKKGQVRFKTIGFEGPSIQRKIEVAIEMLQEGAL